MSNDSVREISGKHTYGTWRRQKGFLPLNIVDAEGSHFTDATGKRYLDLSSQLMCSNLGHKNRAVIDAIKKQAEELAFIAPGYTTTARAELTKELLEVLPKGLNKFFFTTSGTEANEAAFFNRFLEALVARRDEFARNRTAHNTVYKFVPSTACSWFDLQPYVTVLTTTT